MKLEENPKIQAKGNVRKSACNSSKSAGLEVEELLSTPDSATNQLKDLSPLFFNISWIQFSHLIWAKI